MKKIKHIESEVLQALNSLEGIKSASPGPFFFTRVHAKIGKTEMNFWEKLGAVISRPAVAVATICLIIIINVIAIVEQNNSSISLADPSEPVLVDEYNMAVNSFYDYEISEP
jgi:hypothetical protein